MKVLIAVVSSRTPFYGSLLQASKETWDSVTVDGVQTVFYVGEPAHPLQDGVLGIGIEDNLATMGPRNMMAFSELLGMEWDIMARVNASCYVHKTRLLEHCRTLPREGLFLGGTGNSRPDQEWLWGGLQFLISRDVVKSLVAHRDEWPTGAIDDVGLSSMVRSLGFSFNTDVKACSICRLDHSWESWALFDYGGGAGQTFRTFDELGDDQFFYRVRQMSDRDVEPEIMRRLFAHHSKTAS